jgi:hypothetical protein
MDGRGCGPAVVRGTMDEISIITNWGILEIPEASLRYVGVIWFRCFLCSPISIGLDSHNKTPVALANLR